MRVVRAASLIAGVALSASLHGCSNDKNRTAPIEPPQAAKAANSDNPGTPAAAQNAPPHARPAIVTFTAMGCGPYNAAAEKALVRYMQLENQDPRSQFLIHLGDIVTGAKRDWPQSQYAHIAAMLRKDNKIPTFIVPGDNEWNDLLDPDTGWKNWTKHFMNYDRQWTFGPQVMRQAARPENFAFVLNGVLFIGINKVGGRIHDEAEWTTRLKQNAQWIDEHLAMRKGQVRAAVILAQATAETRVNVPIEPAPAPPPAAGAQAKAQDTKPAVIPTRTINLDPYFLTPLKASARKFEKPILYLHADGHKWFHVQGRWEPNILHVQLDLLDPYFPPAQVTVTFDPKTPFQFDRRMEDKKWVPNPPPPPPAADPKPVPAKPAPAKPAPVKPKPTPQPKAAAPQL